MAEYINREEVLKIVENIMSDTKISHKHRAINRNVKQIPAADVTPVRRGHWIEQDNGTHFCSECTWDARWKVDVNSGTKISFVEELSNRCPSCGAIMDERKNK